MPSFRSPQSLFPPFTVRDVLKGFDRSDEVAFVVEQGGGREKEPFASVGEVREKILHLVGPFDERRLRVLSFVVLLDAFFRCAVDDEVGKDRSLLGIERFPLMLGADERARRKTGEIFKGPVAVGHHMTAIDDESRDGKALKDLGQSFLAVSEESLSFALDEDSFLEVLEFPLQGLVGCLFGHAIIPGTKTGWIVAKVAKIVQTR